MHPLVIVALMAGMLLLNYALWKRRAGGWRRHVDAFVAVLQPYVPEPVLDAVVLQPAGAVGRQARAEQGRGLSVLFGGATGELAGAMAEHRANEEADQEGPPPMTALALGRERRYLLPVALANGRWSAGRVERSWAAGDARCTTEGRTLTIQVTIALADGTWTGEYETARDPAKYSESVLATLAKTG